MQKMLERDGLLCVIINGMEYTEADGKITITGGLEGRSVIELPESIGGKPVAAVEKYAFAQRQELTEVVLPESLVRIGAHAFYNCRNLRLAELHDGIRELEDGAFKNCHGLCRVKMHSHSMREGCIRNLLDDNIHEVALDVEYDGGERARVLFPAFEDDYVENTPARIFQAVSYGTGGAYRQCLQSGTLDYRALDGLFARSVREDRFEAALFNSVWRLRLPYRLSEDARQRYTDFLRENGGRAALYCISQDDADMLGFLCGLEVFDEEAARAASAAASDRRNPQLSGIMLEYKSRHFKAKRKSFDL